MIPPRPDRASRRYGLVLGLFALALGVVAGAAPAWSAPRAAGPASPALEPAVSAGGPAIVDYFELTGVIDPVSAKALTQQIDVSAAAGSAALIVRIDTPGGLGVDVRALADRIRTSRVPIVAWVAPTGARAAGAGLVVAEAAPVLVMAPGTTLGPLVPVNLEAKPDPAAATGVLQGEAEANGRGLSTLPNGGSLSDNAAAAAGILTFRAGALGTLLANLDGRTVGGAKVSVAGAELRFHKMALLDRILHAVARPAVAYMLVLLGIFGIVFELYFPGIGAAGLMGGGALLLGLYGFTVLPTSWAALTLVLLGLAAFVPDLHMGGLGVPTAAGTLALAAGSFLLFPHAAPALRLPWWAAVSGVAGTLVFFISIRTAALRARAARPPAGLEGIVGSVGVARTALVPDGEVTAAGSLWRAHTLGAAVAEGTRVRVRSVSGLLLMVEPVPDEEPTAP